jgi:hypothetical protein
MTHHIIAIEATVLRDPQKPRHAFWCVFHDEEIPYVIVDLRVISRDQGPPQPHEVRIRLPSSGNHPHPNGRPELLFREEPLPWSQVQWVPVAWLKPRQTQRIAPEDFHRDPATVGTGHWPPRERESR